MTDTPLSIIPPGPMVVQWEESVTHLGAPFRISLSGDGVDTDPCVLLDHIPHNEVGSPLINVESSYVKYSMVIEIPDIQCSRCSLHLGNPMTDKESSRGAPLGEGCTDPNGDCLVVYHSCTLPFQINGTVPRSEYVCPNKNPDDWPTEWVGDDGVMVDTSELGVYRRESGTWMDSFLMDVPDRYRTIDDSVTPCEGFEEQERVGLFTRIYSRIYNWFFEKIIGIVFNE